MTSMLSAECFAAVIRDAPLVSIDLVVVDAAGWALLGQRLKAIDLFDLAHQSWTPCFFMSV